MMLLLASKEDVWACPIINFEYRDKLERGENEVQALLQPGTFPIVVTGGSVGNIATTTGCNSKCGGNYPSPLPL